MILLVILSWDAISNVFIIYASCIFPCYSWKTDTWENIFIWGVLRDRDPLSLIVMRRFLYHCSFSVTILLILHILCLILSRDIFFGGHLTNFCCSIDNHETDLFPIMKLAFGTYLWINKTKMPLSMLSNIFHFFVISSYSLFF